MGESQEELAELGTGLLSCQQGRQEQRSEHATKKGHFSRKRRGGEDTWPWVAFPSLDPSAEEASDGGAGTLSTPGVE